MNPRADLGALQVHPHALGALLLGWVLPVAAVLLAAVAALAAGRWTPEPPESSPGHRRTLVHLLRAAIQALVYVAGVGGLLYAETARGLDRAVDTTLRFGFAVAMLWVGFVVFDAVEREMHGHFQRQGRPTVVTVLPLLDKIVKAGWALLVLVMFLDNMGMDVKALLAGLGVGGLAVALAGQKTIENLFGGLMLVLDQPVRAGDFCSFGDKSGEVVEVGLRSIKLRTVDRTVITVPNGEFSQLTLENFSKRDRIRLDVNLSLRLDTGAERLRDILKAFEELLAADPGVDPAMTRYARLVRVAVSSLDVEVFCYFRGADWDAYMLWRQDLLLRLMEACESRGGRLAFPTQTMVAESLAAKA